MLDVDAQVRERLGVQGTAMALVRPDGYVGFRGQADSWSKLREHLAKYLIPVGEQSTETVWTQQPQLV